MATLWHWILIKTQNQWHDQQELQIERRNEKTYHNGRRFSAHIGRCQLHPLALAREMPYLVTLLCRILMRASDFKLRIGGMGKLLNWVCRCLCFLFWTWWMPLVWYRWKGGLPWPPTPITTTNTWPMTVWPLITWGTLRKKAVVFVTFFYTFSIKCCRKVKWMILVHISTLFDTIVLINHFQHFFWHSFQYYYFSTLFLRVFLDTFFDNKVSNQMSKKVIWIEGASELNKRRVA